MAKKKRRRKTVDQGMSENQLPLATKRSMWVIKKLRASLKGWRIHPTMLLFAVEHCKEGLSGHFKQTIHLKFITGESVLTYRLLVEVRMYMTRLTLHSPSGAQLGRVQAKKDVVNFCETIDKVLERDFTQSIFDSQLKAGVKLFAKNKGTKARLTREDGQYDLVLNVSKTCPFITGEDNDGRYQFTIVIREGDYILSCDDIEGDHERLIHLGDPDLDKAVSRAIGEFLPEVIRLKAVDATLNEMDEFLAYTEVADQLDNIDTFLTEAGGSLPPEQRVTDFKTELDKVIAIVTYLRARL